MYSRRRHSATLRSAISLKSSHRSQNSRSPGSRRSPSVGQFDAKSFLLVSQHGPVIPCPQALFHCGLPRTTSKSSWFMWKIWAKSRNTPLNARTKLTSFRDNLRTMLAKPSATVKDLVEIQKQLTDTQSELDSETARRKILANETEKIAVEISFRVERLSRNTGGLAQVWNALRDSGSILADSTASLITTIVVIIPWLILVLPAIWLLVKGWRKLKLRRNRTFSPPPSPTAA